MKRVLDVGQCGPDHAAIRRMLERNFSVEVVQAHGPADTLAELEREAIDLVLVNRKLDADYSDGLEIIRQIKSRPQSAETPVMLVSNYPEHQQLAVEAGAIAGFGKLELSDAKTIEKLAPYLA